jgi:hypothetical protein
MRSVLALFVVASLAPGAEEPKLVVLRSKEGKFSVTLPDKPAEKKTKVKTAVGEVDAYLFSVDQKDRGAYLVTYNDYPAKSVGDGADKVLAGVIEANVKALKGKLASEEKITIGAKKHPGREVRIELPDKKGLYRAKLYLVGDRLYQVVAFGPDDFAKSKAVDDYLKSFALDE